MSKDARSGMVYGSPEWVAWTSRMMAHKENHQLKREAQVWRTGKLFTQ